MKEIDGWWFGTEDRKLGYGDDREIRIGVTHEVKEEIVPCVNGLHLSRRIIDALEYAPGSVIWKVRGKGVIVPHGSPVNKYACSERVYLRGGIDISDLLRKFSRICALDVVHLWDAPNIVIRYLKTGDEDLRVTAKAAAWAAGVTARTAAGDAEAAVWTARDAEAAWAAWDAARATGDAAGDTGDAAWAAAGEAAEAAAWDAGDAAWAAIKSKQNRRLRDMVNREIKKRGG